MLDRRHSFSDNRLLVGFLYGAACIAAIVALLDGRIGLVLLLIVVAGVMYAL